MHSDNDAECWHCCLTHWGRVTHICVSKLAIIGSDNGLSPERRQAIIWTNAGLLLIGPLGTNFSEFLVEILIFSFKKMLLKVSSAKRRPFCLGLNVLNTRIHCHNLPVTRWSKFSIMKPPSYPPSTACQWGQTDLSRKPRNKYQQEMIINIWDLLIMRN